LRVAVEVGASGARAAGLGRGAIFETERKRVREGHASRVVSAHVVGHTRGSTIENGAPESCTAGSLGLSEQVTYEIAVAANALAERGVTFAACGAGVVADVVVFDGVELPRHAHPGRVVRRPQPKTRVHVAAVAAVLYAAYVRARIVGRRARPDLAALGTQRDPAKPEIDTDPVAGAGIDITSDLGAVAARKLGRVFVEANPLGLALLIVVTGGTRLDSRRTGVLAAVSLEIAVECRSSVVDELVSLDEHPAILVGTATDVADLQQKVTLISVATGAAGVRFGAAPAKAKVGPRELETQAADAGTRLDVCIGGAQAA
jgi:hypothetical protein